MSLIDMPINLGLSPSATELLDPNLETDAASQGAQISDPHKEHLG